MKKGFYTIMSAQFFSSLADNALLVGAIELLRAAGAPSLLRAGVSSCSRRRRSQWVVTRQVSQAGRLRLQAAR